MALDLFLLSRTIARHGSLLRELNRRWLARTGCRACICSGLAGLQGCNAWLAWRDTPLDATACWLFQLALGSNAVGRAGDPQLVVECSPPQTDERAMEAAQECEAPQPANAAAL